MKKTILAAAAILTASAVQAETATDVEIYTPGVNLAENLDWGNDGILYVKTDIPGCAYGGRIAFPMTVGGIAAFERAEKLHEEGRPIAKLTYDVFEDTHPTLGPVDICVAVNVRKPDYE